VIVKFRDGTSTAARIKSLSLVSAAGAVSERPSYANFDLVRIDPNDDAEAAADALRRGPTWSTSTRRIEHTPKWFPMISTTQWTCPSSIWSVRGTSGHSYRVFGDFVGPDDNSNATSAGFLLRA
jgi:hypothetical protein